MALAELGLSRQIQGLFKKNRKRINWEKNKNMKLFLVYNITIDLDFPTI